MSAEKYPKACRFLSFTIKKFNPTEELFEVMEREFQELEDYLVREKFKVIEMKRVGKYWRDLVERISHETGAAVFIEETGAYVMSEEDAADVFKEADEKLTLPVCHSAIKAVYHFEMSPTY